MEVALRSEGKPDPYSSVMGEGSGAQGKTADGLCLRKIKIQEYGCSM